MEYPMVTISVSIDVPDLGEGARFYGEAFGFARVAEPYPGIVVLRSGSAELLLLEKALGSSPSPRTDDKRRYDRHWTPVHIDFDVDDFRCALARALAAGARQEQLFESPGRPAAAFCSDPFGHGFCLIERRDKQ